MESWRQRINNSHNQRPYGRHKANAPCGRHPNHRQSPGVCSICLNEKLSQLTARRKPAISAVSSSYLSSLTSSDASSCSSPVEVSRSRKSTGIFERSSGEVLKKSRSMAFFLWRSKQENDSEIIKRGFWSRLWQRGSKGLGLRYSRTMRERVIVTGVH